MTLHPAHPATLIEPVFLQPTNQPRQPSLEQPPILNPQRLWCRRRHYHGLLQILEQSLLDSTPVVPIYFILSPGANVVADVDNMAARDMYSQVRACVRACGRAGVLVQ